MNLQQYVRDVGTVCVIRPMLVKLPRESALEVLFRFFELPAFFSARNSASEVFARFFEVVSFFPSRFHTAEVLAPLFGVVRFFPGEKSCS